jgi:hypothetical protein
MTDNDYAMHSLPKGFEGRMLPVGQHASLANKHISEYGATKFVEDMSEALMNLLAPILISRFPETCNFIQRAMMKYDELPPQVLGGINGLCKSMNVSVNLANESHYDPNDIGPGIATWFERVPHINTSQHFLFPNVIVKLDDDTTHNGLAIRIRDGTMISWDGGSLRHCSSIRLNGDNSVVDPSKNENDTYGFHFSDNIASLTRYKQLREDEYRKKMGGVVGPIDWVKYFNEMPERLIHEEL